MRAWPLFLLIGCAVDFPPVIDDGFFVCAIPEDCGDGQGCAEGNVYSADFCRPACSIEDPSSCPDGVCTAAGACLERCTIDPDGTPVGCNRPEFTCVRTDAMRDEGVCFPVRGCSRTPDCNTSEQCMNEALGLPAATIDEDLRFDNLYCSGAPDADDRCPMGYLSFRFATLDGGALTVCYPPCELDGDGPWCPPSTTCFRGFGEVVGTPDTPPCVPGVWGLPCADDTQCLIGRCLPVGRGRRACTETCADAEALGGCQALESLSEVFGTPVRNACELVGDEEVCVPRFDLLSLCSEQLECVGSNTACIEVMIGETRAHVCVRPCTDPQDCAAGTGGTADDYRCLPLEGSGGVCLRKRPLGGSCGDDLDCREGRCCPVGDFTACLTECPPP